MNQQLGAALGYGGALLGRLTASGLGAGRRARRTRPVRRA